MNRQEEFVACITTRQEKTKELLLVKGKEYVREENCFHNFERGGLMNREKPTRTLHGMLTKHLVSYLDILDDIDAGKSISENLVDEKLGDIIVYFHLQEALIKSLTSSEDLIAIIKSEKYQRIPAHDK